MSDLNERLARLAGWTVYNPVTEPNGAILPRFLPDAEHSIDAQAPYEAIARARGWRLYSVYEAGSFTVEWVLAEDGNEGASAPTEPEARALALERVLAGAGVLIVGVGERTAWVRGVGGNK